MDFYLKKIERTITYFRFTYGYKKNICCSCNGSGYYDNHNSPSCGACEGLGSNFFKGQKNKDICEKNKHYLSILKKMNLSIHDISKILSKITKNNIELNKISHNDYNLEKYSIASLFYILSNKLETDLILFIGEKIGE